MPVSALALQIVSSVCMHSLLWIQCHSIPVQEWRRRLHHSQFKLLERKVTACLEDCTNLGWLWEMVRSNLTHIQLQVCYNFIVNECQFNVYFPVLLCVCVLQLLSDSQINMVKVVNSVSDALNAMQKENVGLKARVKADLQRAPVRGARLKGCSNGKRNEPWLHYLYLSGRIRFFFCTLVCLIFSLSLCLCISNSYITWLPICLTSCHCIPPSVSWSHLV